MAAFEILQVTAQYSNAVLLAVMPYVTDFAKNADLPILQPVTINQVREFKCSPRSDLIGGRVILTNGYEFAFLHGRIEMYRNPNSYHELQDPDLVPKFFGPVKLNEKQAVQTARAAIKRLGYSDASVFADSPPRVTKPVKIGKNYVARYQIQWNDPSRGNPDNPPPSVAFEVDATTGQIQMMYLSNPNTWCSDPKIEVKPPVIAKGPETKYRGGRAMAAVSQAYSNAFFVAILPQCSAYIEKTGFSLRVPVTIDDVDLSRSVCGIVDGDPMAMVEMKNGARFVYRHGQVIAFYASDVMQLPGRDDPYPDYEKFQAKFYGPINLTPKEAITLVRQTIKKLGYSEKVLHIDEPPLQISGPIKWGTNFVARIFLNWKESREGAFRVVAEVDVSTKKVKSLYVNDHANTNIWRDPPKIDVPISPPDSLK